MHLLLKHLADSFLSKNTDIPMERNQVFFLKEILKSSACIFFLEYQWINQQATRVKHQREIVLMCNLFLLTTTILCRPKIRQIVLSYLPMYSIHIYIWHPLTKLTPFLLSFPFFFTILLTNFITLLTIHVQGYVRTEVMRHLHLWRGARKVLANAANVWFFFHFASHSRKSNTEEK